jgi:hypothetical protein
MLPSVDPNSGSSCPCRAATKLSYGNLMLTIEQHSAFTADQPGVFLPIHGGWGEWGRRTCGWRRLTKTCSRALWHGLEAARRKEPEARQKEKRFNEI